MLDNKTAIITGANRGIGLEIAKTFAKNGAMVLAGMRSKNTEALNIISASVISKNGSVHEVLLDLSDEFSIKRAVEEIKSLSPKIDILVNNAGIASGGLFQMTSLAEMRRLFEVNFFGQILLTQAVSRLMARNKSGSIINIASTAAEIADSGTLAYGSSKAAFIRATKSMATELGGSGIRVNAISPGVTRTDMYEQMSPEVREKLIMRSSMKRPVESQDVANMALFLASNLSTHVTGQVMRVDGGMV